jgi:hypothetical protein
MFSLGDPLMISQGPRFCPRCGTARVADMPFCAGCGLNVAEFDKGLDVGAGPPSAATNVANGSSITEADASQSSSVDELEGGSPSDAALSAASGPTVDRGFRVPPIVIIALIVGVGVIALGLVTVPQLGGSPGSGGQASPGAASGAPAAPIVGLTILSPTDGQAVASKDVIVIGTAPPGLTITQDISFGFDQHTTVDGTGHWAINVGLNEGDNKLTFRIGDDHSTQQTIRVIYTPPKGP